MNVLEQSEWIWRQGTPEDNEYVIFEQEAVLSGQEGPYQFSVSCDTNYALYVNGTFADCGQYADYEDMKFYDTLDVSGQIHPGTNTFRLVCWYQGTDSSVYRRGTPGVIFALHGAGKLLLASDLKTRCGRHPAYASGTGTEMITGQLGYSFSYDARREGTEVLSPENTAAVQKTRQLLPRPIRKLTVGESLPVQLTVRGVYRESPLTAGKTPAVRMQYASLAFREPNVPEKLPSEAGVLLDFPEQEQDGVFAIVDLEAENAGLLTLDIEVPQDCEILIGWGEHLDDLRIRSAVGGRNFAASYHARAGRNRFFQPFRRLGLRYLELLIPAEQVKIYEAGIRPVEYPLEHCRQFRCADHLHNRIYDVSLRTLRLCMHEHYEDCPWREQALYAMDSRNQMLCGYLAFGETEFARASIRLMAHSLREDHLLELCSPARVPITIPSFTAIFLTVLWEYLEFSGDRDFVREMLPCALEIADGFRARMQNEKHLLSCYREEPYWNFYEWKDGLEGNIGGSVAEKDVTLDAPLNAFVSFGLRSLSRVLEALGDAAGAETYRAEHLALNRAIHREFYNPEKGVYASFSKNGELSHYARFTNSLIVYADAVPEKLLDSVLEALAGDSLLDLTLSSSIFYFDALMRRPEKYGRFVFERTAEIWGHMLYSGATSFWETIRGSADFDNAGSLCHGWSAVPVYLYLKYALSADPKTTGLYECRCEMLR